MQANVALQPAQALVFIDRLVPHHAELVAGALPKTEVILLDPEQDGVWQISETLAEHQGITSLHLVSHGASGQLILGNTILSQETLSQYTSLLMTWSDALTCDAELLIYGCEVGQGARGETFIHRLSELTGATVAASTSKIGNAALGGTWQLDVATDVVRSRLAFQPEIMATYTAVLAAGDRNITLGENDMFYLDGSSTDAEARIAPGQLLLTLQGTTEITKDTLEQN